MKKELSNALLGNNYHKQPAGFCNHIFFINNFFTANYNYAK